MVNDEAVEDLDGDESTSSPLEELLKVHRKEKKDLLAKITSMKHSVAKGDKKRKKDVAAETEEMEKQLKLRHEAEVSALQKDEKSSESSVPSQPLEALEIADESKSQRVSKAQKRREKKDLQAKQHSQAVSEDAVNAKSAPRNIEMAALAQRLATKNMQIHDIPADGDCLYNAIAHQLCQLGVPSIGDEMRKKAADYIRYRKDEFLPFLTDDNGDMLAEGKFSAYCDAVQGASKGENGGAWGGEPEIRALSMSLKRPIEVLQANAPNIVSGAEFDSEPIQITYHRHAYGLGEHYNSIAPLEKSVNSDSDA